MNQATKIFSAIGLLLVVGPCVLFFSNVIELPAVKMLALVGTIAWFTATPLWMSRKLPVDAAEVEI